jgi:hypothetical protein
LYCRFITTGEPFASAKDTALVVNKTEAVITGFFRDVGFINTGFIIPGSL